MTYIGTTLAIKDVHYSGTFCYGRILAVKSRAIFQATNGKFTILSAAKL